MALVDISRNCFVQERAQGCPENPPVPSEIQAQPRKELTDLNRNSQPLQDRLISNNKIEPPFNSMQKVSSAPLLIMQPQPVCRRKGCQHCITCSGIQNHSQYAHLRYSDSCSIDSWPGCIQSPALYFHLRSRQLLHQMRHPQRGIKIWREENATTLTPNDLSCRRNQPQLKLSIPMACTNVVAENAVVQSLGEVTIKLPNSGAREQPAVSSMADSSKALNDTAAYTQDRNSNIASNTTATRVKTISIIDHDSQYLQIAKPATPAMIPVIVQPPTALHVATPQPNICPSAAMNAPLSATSQSSIMSNVSSVMSVDSSGLLQLPPQQAHLQQPHSNESYCQPMESAGSSSALIPVFHQPHAIDMNDFLDPCLEHYYRKQYEIKQEQAFPCHQVIDLSNIVQQVEYEKYHRHLGYDADEDTINTASNGRCCYDDMHERDLDGRLSPMEHDTGKSSLTQSWNAMLRTLGFRRATSP